MEVCLSKERIESFCRNGLPLRLLGVEAFGMEAITWQLEGDCLDLRTFTKPSYNQWDEGDFTDGVLLTFLAPGEAKVIATYRDVDYVCHVVSREMKRASSYDKMEYFIGDMHVHTTNACGKKDARNILTSRSDGSSPFHYAVSTSTDSESFTPRAEGVLRTFRGEEIIRFVRHNARYIRLEILSTAGWNRHRLWRN